MGKSKSALPDLTRAIQLKPDFLAVSSTLCSLPVTLSVGMFFFILCPCAHCSSLCHPHSGQVAEREYPVKAGQHTGGPGGLQRCGEFTAASQITFPAIIRTLLKEKSAFYCCSCSALRITKKLTTSWLKRTSWRSCRRRPMLHIIKGTTALPSQCWRE